MADHDLDLSGRTLGDFVIHSKIGEGGWGLVYRAEQKPLGREVVVKVLHGERIEKGASVERFLREARLASQLGHPCATHVHAFGVHEDQGQRLWWIAMELVRGVTLADWLKAHGPMPLEHLVPYFEYVAEVVYEAHNHGIIHRDLKSSNMMVIERNGRLFPKLLDFGIAKVDPDVDPDVTLVDESEADRVPTSLIRPSPREGVIRPKTEAKEREQLTKRGAAFGSAPYMAPEQWRDAAGVGPAADIYSLGVVIYEAATGRRPFTGKNTTEYRRLHGYGEVPPVDMAAPSLWFGVSRELDRVLQRALSKYPESRQRSVLDLAADLRAVLRTSDREQLRAAAQQWEDRSHLPGLLWGDDVLADVGVVANAAAEGGLSELECSFVVASQRRARRRLWVRRALVALAGLVAVGVFLYRGVMQARMNERIGIESHVEQGRQALLHSESSEAVRHLEQAYQRGEHSPGVTFMLARALQPHMSELARFASNAGRVWSAAFAPDGKRVLTTDDKSARMWDASSGQLLFTMNHGDTVYGAVFSPDGARIITAGGDGTVRIWSAATGAAIRELRYQGSGSNRWRYSEVAMSSHFVAALDKRGRTAHVWDAETGTPVAELVNEAPERKLLAFSADGHWLALSSRDEVRLFATSTWQRAVTIAEPHVRSLSFDPTGPRLAVGTYNGVASIWEVATGVRTRSLREAGASVDAVAFSRDGVLVATASRDGMEQVWDASSGGLRIQSNSHHDKISAIEFSPSGDLMLSAGADGAVVVWNVATGMPVARLEGPKAFISAAHFDPEARRVVGSSWDGTAWVWDAASPYRRWDSPQIGTDCDTEDSLVPDQRFIALSCRNHGTHVWDTARGKLLAELPGVTTVEGSDTSVFPALTTSGDQAAIARGNTVELYALPSGQLLRTIVHTAAVSAVAFAPTGHDLISGAVDGSLLITHDESDPITLQRSSAAIDAVAILTDGRVVATDASERLRVIGQDRNVLLKELAAPSRIKLLRPSLDGRRLVTISIATDAPPVLWDLEQYRLVARLDSQVGRVFTARFVASGHEILTAGADGAAWLWDATTGRPRQRFRGDSHFLVDAVLAPDGSMVVAGGSDGFLRFWDTSDGHLLWTLQVHTSYVIGAHYEGNDIVTRGFAGDIARWALPPPDKIIEVCHASTCTPMTTAEK
ncbi:MAG TPA: protein kinase [Kofleriaceae bacterium]